MKKLALLVLLLASVNSLFGEVISVNTGKNSDKIINPGTGEDLIVKDMGEALYDTPRSIPFDVGLRPNLITPSVDGGDATGEALNFCEGDNKALGVRILPVNGVNNEFTWYKYSKVDVLVPSGKSVFGYAWETRYTAWKEVSNVQTCELSYDDCFDVDYNDFHSVTDEVYVCKVSSTSQRLGTTTVKATKTITLSKTSHPAINNFIPEKAYVCPLEDIEIDVAANITGAGTTAYWERIEKGGDWEEYEDYEEGKIFSFPYHSFTDGTYDYRLAVQNTCGIKYSESLKEKKVTATPVNNESYGGSNQEKKVCIGDEERFVSSINFNSGYTEDYTHHWEYAEGNSDDWTEIPSDKIVYGTNTMSELEITPNSTDFNNRRYRCVTKGICVDRFESPVFTLKVQEPAKFEVEGITPSVDTACVGEEVTYTANIVDSEHDGTVQYQWRINGQIAPEQSFNANNTTFTHTTGTSADAIMCEVKNGDACANRGSESTTETIAVYATPRVIINSTATGCGSSTANLTANVTKGKFPYTYDWSSNEITKAITNKAANIEYTVTVKDVCTNAAVADSIAAVAALAAATDDEAEAEAKASLASASAVIDYYEVTESVTPASEPPLTLTIADSSNVRCNADKNGSINVEISGGVQPYSFTILKDGSPFVSNNDANAIYNNDELYAGIYTIEVTDDCFEKPSGSTKQEKEITITQPDVLKTIVSEYSDVSCYQGGNGSATVEISGGTTPYNIRWGNGQSTEKAVGLFAGTHICNVTDNKGCFATTQFNLNQPNKLAVTVNPQNVSCNGEADGAITTVITGGTEDYNIVVKDENNQEIAAPYNTLSAGNYTITVTDACDAEYTEKVTITQPNVLQYQLVGTDISCAGRKDGQAEVLTAGGVAPISVLWETTATTNIISGLDSAYYSVTITDACGTVTDSVRVNEPDSLKVQIASTNISCNGLIDGEAQAIVSGGTYPYSYNWSNSQTTSIVSNLNKGKHSVNVTDANSCMQIQTVEITQPAPLSATVTKTDVSCNGKTTGEIEVVAEGGSGNYKYSWDYDSELSSNAATGLSAGTYEVTIKDESCETGITKSVTVNEPAVLEAKAEITHVSCFGFSDGEVEIVATNGVGKYTYTWADAANKTSKTTGLKETTLEYTVTDECNDVVSGSAEVTQPEAITITKTVSNASCNGNGDGTITVEANGGTSPYVYNWEGGVQSDKLKGLFAGTYQLNVLDVNACLQSLKVEVTEPSALSVSITKTDVKCNGEATGEIEVTADGGSGNYKYSWDYDATLLSNAAIGLEAGTYEVTISDESCETGISKTVILTEPEKLQHQLFGTDISCAGSADGKAEVRTTGGVGTISILWENAATTNNISGLDSAYYSVTVKDACVTIKDSVRINEPDSLKVQITSTNISCNGLIDGEAQAIVSGGTYPYSYNWSNSQTSEIASNLNTGKHSVNVTDANSCVQIQTAEITQPKPLSAMIEGDDFICFGKSTADIFVSTDGGVAPYTYKWSDKSFAANDTVKNVKAGDYTVTITDACKAEIEKSVTISQHAKLTAEPVITDVSCFGQSDGAVELVAAKGVSPYKYIWENAANTSVKTTGLKADTLSYKVTDACKDTISGKAIVLQPDAMKIDTLIKHVSCNGDGDGSIEVSAKGGAAPYVYNWSGGIQSNKMQGLFAGTYKLTVLDVNACFQSLEIEVTEPTELEILSTVNEPECNSSNGNIDLEILGGTAPYAFKWSNASVSEDLTNIVSDDYSVVVTDKNGCKQDAEFKVSTYVPGYEICMLRVDRDHGKNKIVWEKTHNTPITSVNVYSYYGGVYDYIGSTDSVEESYYDDMLSAPDVKVARYAITTEDACGNESELSPFHQTMHLAASKDVDGERVNLIWTEYIDESGGFVPKWYLLYKGTSDENLVLFDSVSNIELHYTDSIPQGATVYRVAVRKDNPCITKGILKAESGPFSLAMSNIAESEQITTELNIADLEVKIYPNPSEGEFYVEGNFDDSYTYSVYTMSGAEIATGFADSHGFVVDITNEPLGIYTLSITNGEETAVVNLVVQR